MAELPTRVTVTLDVILAKETVDRIAEEVAAEACRWIEANVAQIEAGPLSISQLCQLAFCEGGAAAIERILIINAELAQKGDGNGGA